MGLKFYTKDSAVVLETGYDWVASGDNTHTVRLEDGERVIGYKSETYPGPPDYAHHYDF